MKNLWLILISFFVFQLLSFGQQEAKTSDGRKIILHDNGTWVYADTNQNNFKVTEIPKLEIPKTSPKDQIIRHTGYSLLYDEAHEQASWVAYELTKEETHKLFDRTDKFIVDPLISTGSANESDYKGSGYDRGHLAPAGDMGYSEKTMAESFYYSNMSPQELSFNRCIWKKLEELVRTWAVENEKLYIVTAPVLTQDLPTIGANKISVPKYYYKVILDYTLPDIKGIGFIMPNKASSEPLQSYAVSIDSVESFTGIDFFPLLPDDQEKAIERKLCIDCWSWVSTKTSGGGTKSAASVQCQGITKAGNRCKNMTTNPSGYCYQHEIQQTNNTTIQAVPAKSERRSVSVQCSATTKAGSRCKRMTYSPNGKCSSHSGD